MLFPSWCGESSEGERGVFVQIRCFEYKYTEFIVEQLLFTRNREVSSSKASLGICILASPLVITYHSGWLQTFLRFAFKSLTLVPFLVKII